MFTNRIAVTILVVILLGSGCTSLFDNDSPPDGSEIKHTKMSKPPLGWNSYDCIFMDINDSVTRANMRVFKERYLPAGYKYFVIDDGWQVKPTATPEICIDSFGRCVPDPKKFPDGLIPLITLAHSEGISFGVWIICGAPIGAAQENFHIKGSNLLFKDEIDTNSCVESWHKSFHFKKNSSAIQLYYNSVFELLAQWGVDFVKYDYITQSPDDIAAVRNAINKCGRDIVLSLSARGDLEFANSYDAADMARIVDDVWDDQFSINRSFDAWKKWFPYSKMEFWLDLDMIPFGTISWPGRPDSLSTAQKQTIMTQRAMAASPLMFGGLLTDLHETDYLLTTNKRMLECDQNGVCGQLLFESDSIEIWKTEKSNSKSGWIGIFNRKNFKVAILKKLLDFKLETNCSYKFYDIWGDSELSDEFSSTIDENGVLFLFYTKN